MDPEKEEAHAARDYSLTIALGGPIALAQERNDASLGRGGNIFASTMRDVHTSDVHHLSNAAGTHGARE